MSPQLHALSPSSAWARVRIGSSVHGARLRTLLMHASGTPPAACARARVHDVDAIHLMTVDMYVCMHMNHTPQRNWLHVSMHVVQPPCYCMQLAREPDYAHVGSSSLQITSQKVCNNLQSSAVHCFHWAPSDSAHFQMPGLAALPLGSLQCADGSSQTCGHRPLMLRRQVISIVVGLEKDSPAESAADSCSHSPGFVLTVRAQWLLSQGIIAKRSALVAERAPVMYITVVFCPTVS